MPQQSSYTLRNYTVICRVVIFGTYLVIASITALLVSSLLFDHNTSAWSSLIVCVVALLYTAVAHWLLRSNRHPATAYLLILFYMFLAIGIVWSWGINTPMGILLFALVIVLAGIILTARHALWAAIAATASLMGIQAAIQFQWHAPDTSWTGSESGFSDVIGYSVPFGMLALISWLYNREMERSLSQAQQAEMSLLRQKATLKTQVKKRTAQLRQAQLEEMQQMYRFAELGQLGATMLHDLANHLTTLILEVEGLQSKQQSNDIARTRQVIHYLENIVENARERLNGKAQNRTFNIIQKMTETVGFLHFKAAEADVGIDWRPPARSWTYMGDPTSFAQVVSIIMNNAIEAYGPPVHEDNAQNRRVAVTMERNDAFILIKISDWGKGIPKEERQNLFRPFRSDKKTGLGLGLFIARRSLESYFSANLTLNPRAKHTQFIIKLPRKK